jgi:hypothetical protein
MNHLFSFIYSKKVLIKEYEMNKFVTTLFATTALISASSAMAASAPLTPLSVNGSASITNVTKVSDGFTPAERDQWQANSAWWRGTSPSITFDYGSLYTISDIELSVDNNDYYQVEYSIDNLTWTSLFQINKNVGEVTWGMDTMSTIASSSEYISAIDFTPVQAQFLRVSATGGDDRYSVGEFTAFGSVAAVPVPAAAILFAPVLAGFIGLRRKKVTR